MKQVAHLVTWLFIAVTCASVICVELSFVVCRATCFWLTSCYAKNHCGTASVLSQRHKYTT